jgi:hypothetical protein
VKINEIMIQEGVFDKLAAGVAGAKAAYRAGGQKREGEAKQKELANTFIQDWNEAIGQDPTAATPEFLKQFMHNSTRKSGITVPEPPSTITPASAAAYITKVIGQAMAARRLRANIGGDGETQTTADTTAAGGKTAKPALTTGFAMVDDDPVTLKYKNQDFVRNDKGQWAPMLSPTKPITDTAVAKMFDKQEAAIENWKAAQTGTEPPATTPTPGTTTPTSDASTSAPAPDAPTVDNRTIVDLRSPKGIRDTETEVFVRGHGIVQKQEDGSWRSLVSKAPVSEKDWPALNKMLAAAGTSSADSDATVSGLTPADDAVGAPVDSTATVAGGGVSVTFKKTNDGWVNSDPTKSSTVHKSGTKQYDALERHWAKLNKQPAPPPTVGTTPAAPPAAEPAPAMTESFKRLSKIIHGKI